MKLLARLGMVAVLVAASVVHSGTAAVAQPDHDRIADARVITGLPFTDESSNVGAGVDAGDPTSCFGSTATVWYRWTAAEDGDVVVEGVGDGFAASFSVYAGEPGALVGVVCGAGVGPSRQLFTATAGTTYYIEVGTCCDGAPGGGSFVLDVSDGPAPVDTTVVVDRHGTVERGAGVTVTVTGTVTCTREAIVRMTVHLAQKRGRGVVTGSAEIGMPCGPEPSPWQTQVSIDPPDDVNAGAPPTFRPGPVRLTVFSTPCDEFRCYSGEPHPTSRLHLRH